MPRGLSTWFLILATGSTILEWIDKALEDGKVTIIEAADLITKLGAIWGFSVELPMPEAEEAILTPELKEGEKPDGTGKEPDPVHRQTE